MFSILSQMLHPVNLFASVPLVMNTPPEPVEAFHEAPYSLGWDIDFSPYSGGSDLLFLHRSLERIEEYLVVNTQVYYTKTPAARFWRFVDLFSIWLPANYFTAVVQHEVFGHGYRIRDIGDSKVRVSGYSFNTPIPYGPGGGVTNFWVRNNTTTTDASAIAIGGVESTAILAQLTKFEWLMAGKIDPRQTVLYLMSEQDLTFYVGSLDPHDAEVSTHDISQYLETLRWTYPNGSLSKSRLKLLAIVNWFDPFTFYSAYAWLHYFWSGKEGHIPMIKIGSYGYLPGARMGLTPFGPEFFLENYLVKDKNPIYFYGKGGAYGGNTYLGIGWFAPKIWTLGRWALGGRFDAWRQPKLLLQPGTVPINEIDFRNPPDPNNPLYSDAEQHAMRLGCAASAVMSVDAYKRLGFQAEAGYKSQGFLPGNALKAAPIARVYMTLVF